MTTDRPAFSVPQISELLHVSTRTIERRLAEYGISARSFSTITDDNSLVLKKILHLSFNTFHLWIILFHALAFTHHTVC